MCNTEVKSAFHAGVEKKTQKNNTYAMTSDKKKTP